MPRYVILFHAMPSGGEGNARGDHYDLMLERDGQLRTWAVAEEPQPGRCLSALQLADHRLDYLTYEGPVSQNRGEVTRWDVGEYELLCDSADRVEARLAGRRLQGVAVLRRVLTSEDGWWLEL